MGIKLNRLLQLVLTPAAATSTIFAAQANAATFSFSQVSLYLDNFSQSPQDVFADTDVSAIALSDGGLITANVEFDSVFFTDESQVFVNSQSENTASGEGSRFFGEAQFESYLMGTFDLSAGQDFSFDFEVSLNLENTVDSPQSGSVSTLGRAGFSVIDNLNQELGFLDILGVLNTNLSNAPDNGFSLSPIGGNITVTDNSFSQYSSEGRQESAQVFIEGSFQQRFDDDTQLTLAAFTTNQSCVQAPKVADACVKVPEPSNVLALMVFGSLLGVLPSVMKQVVKLTR